MNIHENLLVQAVRVSLECNPARLHLVGARGTTSMASEGRVFISQGTL